MELRVSFPEGQKSTVEFEGFTVHTDQSEKNGGQGTAPDPYSYFLASLASCAGIYVLRFCQSRQLDTTGLGITLNTEPGPDGKGLSAIHVGIQLPQGFPDKYRDAVIKAADQCAVKKTILNPPIMEVSIC